MPIEVAELIVYPIKSLRGISVGSSPLERRGLRHDRRWMLVDEAGLFFTQRRDHRLALIDTAFADGGLQVGMAGKGSIQISIDANGQTRKVQVWQSVVDAIDVGASEWFTAALEQPCSLVYMPDSTERPVGNTEPGEGEIVGFADSNPVLVAGTGSLDDLNRRMSKSIPIRRFRPNIVLRNARPFEEDDWTAIEIGDVRLRKTRGCGRCAVTTIDIETGIAGDEPLRTLNTYRKFDTHVFFGTYYVPEALGDVAVGDVAIVK